MGTTAAAFPGPLSPHGGSPDPTPPIQLLLSTTLTALTGLADSVGDSDKELDKLSFVCLLRWSLSVLPKLVLNTWSQVNIIISTSPVLVLKMWTMVSSSQVLNWKRKIVSESWNESSQISKCTGHLSRFLGSKDLYPCSTWGNSQFRVLKGGSIPTLI